MNGLCSTILMLAQDAAPHAVPHATSVGSSVGAEVVSPLQPVLILELGAILAIAGMMLCLFRMVRGPHLADRVLSGDTFAYQVVGLVILLTVRMESTTYLDGALVVAIIGFASTLAFAQYIGNLKRQTNS